MKQAITLVTLAVDDLPRALAFYRDGFGWTPHMTNEHVAFFQMNGLAFSLFVRSGLEHDFEGAITMGGKSIALAHNVATRDEVDAILKTIGKLEGATRLQGPTERIWGGYSGYFEDPDGHLWEVGWNPHWTLTPEGAVTMS